MPEKVFFHGIWPDFFSSGEHVFWLNLLNNAGLSCQVASNPQEATVLCESHFGQSLCKAKSWKKRIFFSGESILNWPIPNVAGYNLVLSSKIAHPNTVPFPWYLQVQHPPFPIPSAVPPHCIAGVIGTITRHGGDTFRKEFTDALFASGLELRMGGAYANNIGYRVGGSWKSDELTDFYKQHKFVLALENTSEEYYITEKIINALKAGAVPIYYGSPRIAEFFNKNRIVIVTPETMSAAIAKIKFIASNDTIWSEMVKQPVEGPRYNTIMDEITAGAKARLQG